MFMRNESDVNAINEKLKELYFIESQFQLHTGEMVVLLGKV